MKARISTTVSTLVAMVLIGTNAQAHRNIAFKNNAFKTHSTYVTPQKDPEHFTRYNASRTCGQGHNAMNAQHRRSHQYRRPHTHIYMPWHPGCDG